MLRHGFDYVIAIHQLGGKLNTGRDVFLLQRWVLMQNLFHAFPGSQEFQDRLHRDAFPTDRGFAIANLIVNRNPLSDVFHNLFYSLTVLAGECVHLPAIPEFSQA
jgi:hypothetical protein